MKSLILRPYGGLANRMRTVAAGVQLSKDIDIPLKVIWVSEKNFNCKFDKIFKNTDNFLIENNPLFSSIRYPRYYQIYHKFLVKYINAESIGKLFYDKYFYGTEKIPLLLDPALRQSKSIYITSCYDFRKIFSLNTIFEPIDLLEVRISRLMEEVGDSCIGIHIRRSDNARSIKESPIHLFKERMQCIIEQHPNTTFFLATDCLTTEAELKRSFGDRVFIANKKLDRNSIEGIQDAVVDLYCLSRTKMILGSSSSSFSEIAGSLSSSLVPLNILKD